jgi:hypothetical protein
LNLIAIQGNGHFFEVSFESHGAKVGKIKFAAKTKLGMLSAKEIKLIDSITSMYENQLVEDHQQADEFDFFEQLQQSNLIQGYANTYFYKSFQINKIETTTKLFFVQSSYVVYSNKSRYTQNEVHLLGVKQLDKDFGNIEIRPEKISDKIVELLRPQELDFKEFPKFSKKYYMLANNHKLAHEFATKTRIAAIENLPDVYIHVQGNLLAAKFLRIVNHDDFVRMMSILEAV